METPQGELSPPPATARAEELLDRTGQRLAVFALQARQRLQEAVSSIRTEADRMDQPSQQEEARAEIRNGATHTDQRTTSDDVSSRVQPGTTRAEGIVDNWTQRISVTAVVGSLQVQRLMARMREETEDIWAEAQDIKGRGGERQEKEHTEQKMRMGIEKGEETKGKPRNNIQEQHERRGDRRERSTDEGSKTHIERSGK